MGELYVFFLSYCPIALLLLSFKGKSKLSQSLSSSSDFYIISSHF